MAAFVGLAALLRARDLLPGSRRDRQGLALALAGLAVGTTALISPVYAALTRVTGVANIGEPIARTALMACAVGILGMVAHFAVRAGVGVAGSDADRRGPRWIRRHRTWFAAAVVALWTCFGLGPQGQQVRSYMVTFAGEPAVQVYALVFIVFVGGAFAELLRLGWRMRATMTGQLATSGWLITLGAAAGCFYVVLRLVGLGAVIADGHGVLESLAWPGALLAVTASILLVAGTLWLAALARVRATSDGLAAHAKSVRLYPLWRDLMRLRPAVAMEPDPGPVREVLAGQNGRLAALPSRHRVARRCADSGRSLRHRPADRARCHGLIGGVRRRGRPGGSSVGRGRRGRVRRGAGTAEVRPGASNGGDRRAGSGLVVQGGGSVPDSEQAGAPSCRDTGGGGHAVSGQVDVEARTSEGESGGLRLRLARAFTELLAPSVVGVICPVAIGALSDTNAWRGAGLGLLGAVFTIGLPYAYIAWLVRTGGATDRHVSRREDRPKVLVAVLLCLAAGITVLVLLGAPLLLVWLLVGEVLLVLACLVISKSWKISMHSAVAAGTVTALVVVLSPWALLAGIAVVLVSWGRVVLRDHTVAQVTAGALLGAACLSLLGFVR